MKRLAIAIIVAVFFVALSMGGEYYSLRLCEHFLEALEQAAEEIKAGDYERAEQSVLALSTEWESKKIVFSIFLISDEPLSYGRDFYALSRNMQDKNYSNALILIRECQSNLYRITDD